jgi:hypothetical protein
MYYLLITKATKTLIRPANYKALFRSLGWRIVAQGPREVIIETKESYVNAISN